MAFVRETHDADIYRFEPGHPVQSVAASSFRDTSTTIFGFTHRNAAMSSAVMPSPQWPVLLLGRFAKGDLGLREGLTYRFFVIHTAAILWPLRRVTSLRSRT